MVRLFAKVECFAPKLRFSLKLIVPELVAVVFGGVWGLQRSKRSAGVVGFAIAGSEEKGNGQYAKLE
jgi:hypothetical protein